MVLLGVFILDILVVMKDGHLMGLGIFRKEQNQEFDTFLTADTLLGHLS